MAHRKSVTGHVLKGKHKGKAINVPSVVGKRRLSTKQALDRVRDNPALLNKVRKFKTIEDAVKKAVARSKAEGKRQDRKLRRSSADPVGARRRNKAK